MFTITGGRDLNGQRRKGPLAVSIIGLGKLGAPMAACYASMGCRVVGLDLDAAKVACINRGAAPVTEPDLQRLIDECRLRLSATQDWSEAVMRTDLTFIIVPTPSESDGGFTSRYVVAACREIGAALRHKGGFHLVVVCSTVMPGAMDREVRPALEATSGKRCGVDLGLCYSPRFIALGTVVRDFLSPDLVLIGESDPRSGEALESFYRYVHANSPPVVRMGFANAELTKLAVNTFVTTKISFANMLAAICERLPGGDIDAVTGALGLDSRIGPKSLKGALGYGGPCFPRDNLALSSLARGLGVPASIAEATDGINRRQVSRLVEMVKERLPAGGAVGVLGLAYKPNTDVVDESPGLELARHLLAQGVPVWVYDPLALENGMKALGDGPVRVAQSLEACAQAADVLVLATPWPEFAQLSPDALRAKPRPPVIIDCWRLLDGRRFAGVAHYVAVGVEPPYIVADRAAA